MRLEAIEPFGVRITATRNKLREFSAGALDEVLKKEKLVLLRGFEDVSRDEFLQYCQSYPAKQLLQWDFGPVMEMKETPNPKNYLFSRERVPFHWDGAFHQVPAYLVFYCVEAPKAGAGGETLFCNTEKIWENADASDRATWSCIDLTYETDKIAHYGGNITGPLVQEHPKTGKTILRFAEPVTTDMNPVALEVRGTTKESFLKDMTQRIYDPAHCYAHEWKTGDILIADNHSLVHGRRAFEKDSPRHLRRIQLI